ncbi:MAG: hypothetical protein JNJ91_00485 [Flavobacteriales bacterium]|nr:hypothetical protein [Flavobacteriales bacterium]
MAGRRSDRYGLSAALLFVAVLARAQPGSTFAYTGKDAAVSALDVQNAHFGGFGNSTLVGEDERIAWPWLPTIFYEYGRLLSPQNKLANLIFSARPELHLYPWLMGRVSGLVEVGLGADAHNRPGQGLGCSFGVGYSAFGATFGLSESSPVLRAGITIDNIRITYMHSTTPGLFINHHLGVGLKFDW